MNGQKQEKQATSRNRNIHDLQVDWMVYLLVYLFWMKQKKQIILKFDE